MGPFGAVKPILPFGRTVSSAQECSSGAGEPGVEVVGACSSACSSEELLQASTQKVAAATGSLLEARLLLPSWP